MLSLQLRIILVCGLLLGTICSPTVHTPNARPTVDFKHYGSNHNNVVWCPMPPFSTNSTRKWKNIYYAVHCSKPVILSSPQTDSYKEFEQKLCDVHSQHSMPLSFIHDDYKDIIPVEMKQSFRLRHTVWISYGLLLWSIRNLQPKTCRNQALWLEFGVAKAHSTNLTSFAQRHSYKKQLHNGGTPCNNSYLSPIIGFDTFQGLPSRWGVFPSGAFGNGGHIPPAEANIHFEVGLFQDTLPLFLARQAKREAGGGLTQGVKLPVGFVNIDNDLYEGSLFILSQLQHRFAHGSVIHFHELFAHNKKQLEKCAGNDEMKALYDFLKTSELNYNLQFMPYDVAFHEPGVFRVVVK